MNPCELAQKVDEVRILCKDDEKMKIVVISRWNQHRKGMFQSYLEQESAER